MCFQWCARLFADLYIFDFDDEHLSNTLLLRRYMRCGEVFETLRLLQMSFETERLALHSAISGTTPIYCGNGSR